MQRRAFLKRWMGKFLIALLLVGILVYTFFHVLAGTSSSLMTTPVKTITDTQILEGEAYLFRDESVLTTPTDGVVDAVAVSGSKVAQGVDLAHIWTVPAEHRAAMQKSVDQLNRLLSLLESSLPGKSESLSAASSYQASADAAFLSLCRAVRTGDLSKTVGLEREILTLINRYNELVGSHASLEDAIAQVSAEKNALLIGAPTTVRNTERSGYFYDREQVDGYETLFTAAAARELNADSFSRLCEAEPLIPAGQTSVGKMAYGYDWYLAVSFSGPVELFSADASYAVTFPDDGDRTLTLVCERFFAGLDGETVVLLRSDVTPADFSYLRRQTVQVTARVTEGYYVPEGALWTVDEVLGVYVFEESTVYFRRVNLLLEGDGYVIVEPDPEEDGYLALNDIMILSGGKLYDGKVYR